MGGGAEAVRRMLSAHVSVRPVRDRKVSTRSRGIPRQRVPSAANLATEATLDFVTNAGPVRTGATPPPLMLPFVRYSHSASTARDRKSTRLNSSHVKISYAVFRLQ